VGVGGWNLPTYEGQQELRRAVEIAAKRSVTDKEWDIVAPSWNEPYDDSDLTELLDAVRYLDSTQPKPSAEEKARIHRRAHVERAANETKELAESYRQKIFGHTYPPFVNRGFEAADWIESQVEAYETKRFSIEFTIPAKLGQLESLIWVKEFLTQHLDRYSLAFVGEDDARELVRLLENSGAVRGIGWSMPILEYLGRDQEGEITIRCVQAPDGTLLGKLQDKAEQLAKALAWEPYAAVHHLLTGGVVSSAGVRAITHYRVGKQSYGDSHPMTLTISDPESVTGQELTTAFRRERSNLAPPWNKDQRQRSRISTKSERVAAFVEETQEMPWEARFDEWNLRNPEDRFRTLSAIKQAYRRARQL